MSFVNFLIELFLCILLPSAPLVNFGDIGDQILGEWTPKFLTIIRKWQSLLNTYVAKFGNDRSSDLQCYYYYLIRTREQKIKHNTIIILDGKKRIKKHTFAAGWPKK